MPSFRTFASTIAISIVFAATGALAQNPPPPTPVSKTVSVDFFGKKLVVPVPDGHCRMDKVYAFDKAILDDVTALDRSDERLVLATMDCAGLTEGRQGKPVAASAFVIFSDSDPDPVEMPRKDLIQLICDTMQSDGTEAELKSKEPLARADELFEIGKTNDGSWSWSLIEAHTSACYTGSVRLDPDYRGAARVISDLTAATVIGKRLVGLSLVSIGKENLAAQHKSAVSLVAGLERENGEQ